MLAALRLDMSAPRRGLNLREGCWYAQVFQGETYVTTDAREVLPTVLVSCIASSIRDPITGVSGILWGDG